jgi:hypothetical protein
MPKTPRPGKASLYIEIPESLDQALRARAQAERRPLTTTIIIALEQYLGLGPTAPAAPAGTEPSGQKPAPKKDQAADLPPAQGKPARRKPPRPRGG